MYDSPNGSIESREKLHFISANLFAFCIYYTHLDSRNGKYSTFSIKNSVCFKICISNKINILLKYIIL